METEGGVNQSNEGKDSENSSDTSPEKKCSDAKEEASGEKMEVIIINQ